MRSRTAAAVASGLGLFAGGAAFAVPAFAGNEPSAAVVDDTTPDPSAPDDETTTDDTTTDDSGAEDSTPSDEADTDESDASESEATAREPGERLAAALQPLVDDGTLTQEQADAVVATLLESFPTQGRGERVAGGGLIVGLNTLTEVLGVSAEELHTALADGQSIADVATAQGVEVQTVIDALVAAAGEHLDTAVADGRLTAEQADERRTDLTERITELVERPGGLAVPAMPMPGGPHRPGDGPGNWPGGNGPGGWPGGNGPGGHFPGEVRPDGPAIIVGPDLAEEAPDSPGTPATPETTPDSTPTEGTTSA